ncbi:MAG: lipopolysaccharide biosynthesis protein [Acidobacteriota bacterium]
MLKRILKALTAMVAGQGITILANVLLVPLYLKVWSIAVYGEWLAIFSAVSYLTNLDLGMQMYVVNRLTRAYTKGDIEDYRTCQHTALAFYLSIALIGTAILLALAVTLPISSMLNIIETHRASAAIVIVLLGSQLLWSLPAGLCLSIYRTAGDLNTTQWLANLQRILAFGFTAGTLLIYPTMPAIACVQLIPLMVTTSYAWWDGKRRYPQFALGLACANWKIFQEMIRPSLFFALIILAMAIGLHGSTLLIAATLGAASVALFVTTRTLTNMVRQLIGLIYNAAWPDLTRLDALAERRQLRTSLRLLVTISTGGCLAVAACLWFEGTEIFSCWTAGRLAPDPTLLRLMLVYLVLQSPWLAASAFPLATNQHRSLSLSYLIANAGGLVLAALLIPWLGINGLPIALICGEALACYHFVLRDACRQVEEDYLRFAARLWTGMLAIAFTAGLSAWTIHHFSELPMLLRWSLSGAGSLLMTVLVSWQFWLRNEERIWIRSKIFAVYRHQEGATAKI